MCLSGVALVQGTQTSVASPHATLETILQALTKPPTVNPVGDISKLRNRGHFYSSLT